MKRKFIPVAALVLMVLACQVIPTPPPINGIPTAETADKASVPARIPTAVESTLSVPTPGSQISQPDPTGGLLPFPTPGEFSKLEPLPWDSNTSVGELLSLPHPLVDVPNRKVTEGLTLSQRAYLEENGFVVVQSSEGSFQDVRSRVALQHGQPFYLTTDAAFHTLGTNFDELVVTLERESLYPLLLEITQSVYDELLSYLPLVKDTSLEEDAILAAAYMGVALRLLDPQVDVDPELGMLVYTQVAQIQAAQDIEASSLIPGFLDDYRTYLPTGHYTGDPILEAYYRAMKWYSRVHFPLTSSDPQAPETRAPLLITLALRQSVTANGEPAAEAWQRLNQMHTFINGGTAFDGPPEYAAIMDQVYGPRVTLISLADEPLWRTFQDLAGEVPLSRKKVPFFAFIEQSRRADGWRFMGERFDSDSFILESLVYDQVSDQDNRRDLPSGLDIMAVWGSDAAEMALELRGDKSYLNYPEQQDILQNEIADQSADIWMSGAYGAWMYALYNQLSSGDGKESFAYMEQPGWGYRALDGALHGWLAWRHDRAVPEVTPSSSSPEEKPISNPAPCYVEPRPLVFYRLAYLAGALVDGLIQNDMEAEDDADGRLAPLIQEMLDLSDRFVRLGDIAAKELMNEPLDASDCALVNAPLGGIEKRLFQSQLMAAQRDEDYQGAPPVSFVEQIAQSDERVLLAGVGLVDRIYLLVPIDGQIVIAQGGVASYYEFVLPRGEALNDDVWRQLIAAGQLAQPAWRANYLSPGGVPVDILAFRQGDAYRVTPVAGQLGLREAPDPNLRFIHRLDVGDYLTIIDGPEIANNTTWWKFQAITEDGQTIEGWALEDERWFERAWGQ